MSRKPHHVSHANTETAESRKATADEMRHVADLVEGGQVHIRNGHEGAVDSEGWQDMSFQRKVDPSLPDA